MDDSKVIDALLLPFGRDLLPLPERAFLMRAEPHQALRDEWRARLVCEQGFKPAHHRLTQAGFETVARLDGRFPCGLLLLTKHKAENRANLARAWNLLETGGTLVVCGANALGAGSHEKEADKVFGGLAGSLAKHQARCFWIERRDGEAPPELAEWLAAAQPRPVEGCGLQARVGCFSADHVDKGSRLLMESLPELAGRGADLGAGWGYLSAEILRRFPEVAAVDLFEAEDAALEDARTNLGADSRCVFHWADVAAGLPKCEPYDWIVSNPPFHEGRKADPGIGQAFITAAWAAIRRRGKFLMVANRSLPYEAELRRRFREVTLLKEADGFKVYLASNRHDR